VKHLITSGENRIKRLLVNHLQLLVERLLKREVNEQVEIYVMLLVEGHLTRKVGWVIG